MIRFTTTSTSVFDNNSQGIYVNSLIDKVVSSHKIDTKRIYLTGQSMGGILDFALNDAYPQKFAATFYVSCQPGGEVDDEQYKTIIEKGSFVHQKFVYLASRLDEKAPFGQDDVSQKMIYENEPFDFLYGLDHKDTEALNTLIQTELKKNYEHFFFGYKQLTSSGNGGAEHMQSFKYAYQLESIYQWLINQSL